MPCGAFAQSLNVVRSLPDKQVGYAWHVTDTEQLELVKYAYFSSNGVPVCKRLAVFGGMMALGSNDSSDSLYAPTFVDRMAPAIIPVPKRNVHLISPFTPDVATSVNAKFDATGSVFYSSMYTTGNGSTVRLYKDAAGVQSVPLVDCGFMVSKNDTATDQLIGLVSMSAPFTSGEVVSDYFAVDNVPLPGGECLVILRKPMGSTTTLVNEFDPSKPVLATFPSDAVLCLVHMTSSFQSVKASHYIRAVSGTAPSTAKYNFWSGAAYYPVNGILAMHMPVQSEDEGIDFYWNNAGTPFAQIGSAEKNPALIFMFKPTAAGGVVSTTSMVPHKVLKVPYAGNVDYWSSYPALPKNATPTAMNFEVLIGWQDDDPAAVYPAAFKIYDGFSTELFSMPLVDPNGSTGGKWFALTLVLTVNPATGAVTDAYSLEGVSSAGGRNVDGLWSAASARLLNGTFVSLLNASSDTEVRVTTPTTSSRVTLESNTAIKYNCYALGRTSAGAAWVAQIITNGFVMRTEQQYPGGQLCEACPDGGFVVTVHTMTQPQDLSTAPLKVISSDGNATLRTLTYSQSIVFVKFNSAGLCQWVAEMPFHSVMYVSVVPTGQVLINNVATVTPCIDATETAALPFQLGACYLTLGANGHALPTP